MTRIAYVSIIARDRIYSLPILPEGGREYQADHYLETGNGPAATTAVAIAKLGVEVDFIGHVGDDSCENTLSTELEGWGTSTVFYRRYPHARSSQSVILIGQHGEQVIVNYPGPDLGTDAKWLGAINLSCHDLILVDAYWYSGTEKAFSLARLVSVIMLLDANTTPQDVSLPIALADHAVFSTPGLKRTTGLQSPEEGLFQATIQTAGRVYVALSSEGSLQTEDGHLCQQGTLSVNVVDTTGVGDVFYGAFAVALTEKMPAKETTRFTSAAAVMKYTQPDGRAGISNRKQTEPSLSPYT